MGPLAIAGIAAGIGALGSLAASGGRNSIIKDQANTNWNNTLGILDLQRNLDFNNLKQQGDEINNAVGMQLTQLVWEENKAAATTVATTTDKDIFGITATRLQGQDHMEAALMADNITQAAESAMLDVQRNLSNANYKYNTGVYNASVDRQNMLNQRQTGMERLTGAVSTGMSFGASAYGMAK